MQHMDSYEDRKAKIDIAVAMVKDAVDTLKAEGLDCDIVGGGGTGLLLFREQLGRLQRAAVRLLRLHGCRLRPHPRQGRQPHRPGRMGERAVHPDLVMSHAKADKAICDAGLKAQSVDSGLPFIFGRDDVEYVKCSDEHGVIADPDGVLKVNDKLQAGARPLRPDLQRARLVCRRAQRQGRNVWPVSARGKAY
jgi:3-hydroxy-D-aspartate aldolase